MSDKDGSIEDPGSLKEAFTYRHSTAIRETKGTFPSSHARKVPITPGHAVSGGGEGPEVSRKPRSRHQM
ncbi:hypothetical protein, partial [Amycolatopsis thailandensis]|uniref:hypothetical protein n=1 Tax=Amycolatopsis thailandensis TaxID=589330 RepID=UPI0036444BCD